MGGFGNGGWRGALRIAQRQATLQRVNLLANSVGVCHPSRDWGRSVLESLRPAASVARACCREENKVSFNSSSRGRPLKLSLKAFWVGLQGAELCLKVGDGLIRRL
jgi:hypothetical protein